VHRFYNYKTKHAILSRNYVLLNQTFGTYYRLAQADICRLEKELTDDLDHYDNNHKKGEEEDDDYEVHFDLTPTIITNDDSTNYVMVEDDDVNEDQPEDHDNHTLFSEDSTEVEDDLTSNFEQDLEIMIADQAAEERALDLPQNVARRLNLPREVLNLDTFYNRIGSLLESDEESTTSTITMENEPMGERALLTIFKPRGEVALLATVYDGSPEPKTLKESLECPDSPNWWAAIKTEFRNMEEKGVWQIKTKDSIPPNRKLIGVR
jgi:hypothetical protein